MQETQETWAWSLGQEDPLEKERATYSSIPWIEEPGGLQSMWLQRVGHKWTHVHILYPFWLRLCTWWCKCPQGLITTFVAILAASECTPPTSTRASASQSITRRPRSGRGLLSPRTASWRMTVGRQTSHVPHTFCGERLGGIFQPMSQSYPAGLTPSCPQMVNDLIMNWLLTLGPSLASSYSLRVLFRITSKINYLPSNPCLRICFWENLNGDSFLFFLVFWAGTITFEPYKLLLSFICCHIFHLILHLPPVLYSLKTQGAQPSALWQPSGMGWGMEWGGSSGGRGHIYTHGWFMLMYGRGQHNIVKQLCACARLLQSYSTLYGPMDCSPPGSSVHGILQARILEWISMCSSRGSSQPRDWTHISCTAGKFFTGAPPEKPCKAIILQ